MSDRNIRWRDLYQQALLELDPARLEQCITSAEAAIRSERDRLKTGSSNDNHAGEWQEMDDALHVLSSLWRVTKR